MTLGDVLRGLPDAPAVVEVGPVDAAVFDDDACTAPEEEAEAAAAAAVGMISCAFHNERPPAEANHLLPGAGAGYVMVASTLRGEYDTAGTAAVVSL